MPPLEINTDELLDKLVGHARGDFELSNNQIRAIEILLKKTLPDLKSEEINVKGSTSNSLTITIRQE